MSDIPKVLYAPHKAFKQIIQNPKYLGVIAVLIICIAAQVGSSYIYAETVRFESTSPNPLDTWIGDSTLWQANPNAAITPNYDDTLDNIYFGNSSLQFTVTNSASLSITLDDFTSINAGPDNYQNLSMRLKIIEPLAIPANVILTLYSLSESNYFQYNLTPEFASSTADSWTNITIPVGSTASNWQSIGNPQWSNITSLSVDFTFPESSDVTLLLGSLFFRGQYLPPLQVSGSIILYNIISSALFQFAFLWLLFAGLMYVFIKALKGNVIWRPLFIAVGFALIVTAIQAVLNAVATAALPTVYYPIEYSASIDGGVGLLEEARALYASIETVTATYSTIIAIIAIGIYSWLAALGAFIVHALLPEFTLGKSLIVSAGAIVVTLLVNTLMTLLGF